MALVSLLDVSLSFGGAPLLDRVNLQLERGERVCLVGRNGAGKSTLMKVIAGELVPDEGQIFRSPPDAVIATGAAFPGRSRPLCAYPRVATYKGSGSMEDASSFACR